MSSGDFSSTLPRPAIRDEASAVYFDALATGALVLRSCRECGHVGRPDAAVCSSCHSNDLSWVQSSGQGTVVATIVDRTDVEAPVLALVELREGPWIMTRILCVGSDRSVPQATAVRLQVVKTAQGESIPAFVLCSATGDTH